ncbi:hypothetical protein EUGRSUZ_L02095 [Eucalyptus grandis]|uniref:Uncharacterized protein n=1 Tax=Eucalyptus grandis TaxID=71139 RepID=A0A058ZSV2_EUCGR|nr:hypothetical protein EUGRSUZ_L02095 [Eucalyptus grandis]
MSLLRLLDLSKNQLNGLIPQELFNLHGLEYLALSDNNLSGSLASSFMSLGLSHIHMNGNKLNGSIVHLLTNNSNLVTLDLSENEIFGSNTPLAREIPPKIAISQDMLVLNLSHNKLTGHIPMSLSNLTKIESIDLSYNNLIGSIPEELMQLIALEVFNVSYDDLSGAIPNKNQFGSFDESNYYGNNLMCGLPLSNDCSTTINVNCSATKSRRKAKEDGFIDRETFYISFRVSYTMVLLVIPVVLFINPQWRQKWFHYVELVITTCQSLFITCYYFVQDGFRKLSSGRTI